MSSTSTTPKEFTVLDFLPKNQKEIDFSIAVSISSRRNSPWWFDKPFAKDVYFPPGAKDDVKFSEMLLDYCKIRENLRKTHDGQWVIICDSKIFIFGSRYEGFFPFFFSFSHLFSFFFAPFDIFSMIFNRF